VHVWDEQNQEWIQRGYSDIYEIQAADLGTIISLPLFSEAPVYAGEEALVVAGHYRGAIGGTDDVSFMYGQPVEDGMVYGFDGVSDAFWLSSLRAIVCSAQFECGLSVDEMADDIQLAVYPNPANEQLTVELTALSENAQIELLDMNGKVVHSEKHSFVTGQLNSVSVNVFSIEEGVYTLTIRTNEGIAQERVILTH